jgi:cell pole-organizing protein PopZ
MAGQYADSQKSMEDILSSIRETIEEDMKAGKNWTETTLGKVIASAAPSAEKEDVFELTQMVNEDGSVTDLSSSPSANDAFDLAVLRAEKEEAERASSQDLDFSDSESLTSEEALLQETMPSFEVENFAAQEMPEEVMSFDTVSAPQEEKVEDLFDLAVVPQASSEASTSSEIAMDALDVDALFAEAPSSAQDVTVDTNDFDQTEPQMSSFEEDQAFLSEEALSASTLALSELSQTVGQQSRAKRNGPPPEGVGAQTLDEIMQDLLRPMLKEWLDARLPSLVKWIVTEQIEKMIQQSQEPKKDS